jgi:hypothetical protein
MEPPPRTLPLVVIKKPSSLLLLDEGIAVEFLDDVRLSGAAADVVEDHQPGERAAVYEHDLRVDLRGPTQDLKNE